MKSNCYSTRLSLIYWPSQKLKQARKTSKKSKEWIEYKKARNQCTNRIRYTKANYRKDKFSTTDSPKSFRTLVNNFKSNSATERVGPLKQEGVAITNNSENANLMNNFFAGIGKKLAMDMSTERCAPNSHIYCVTSTLSNIKLSKQLLMKSFKSAAKFIKVVP